MVELLAAAVLVGSPPEGQYRIPGNSTTQVSIEIEPGNAYTYRSLGCFHRTVVKGAYRFDGGTVTLRPDARVRGDGPRELVVVAWDGATLLVPKGKMDAFCARYRRGWQGQMQPENPLGLFDLYTNKEYVSLKGRPIASAPWAAKLKR